MFLLLCSFSSGANFSSGFTFPQTQSQSLDSGSTWGGLGDGAGGSWRLRHEGWWRRGAAMPARRGVGASALLLAVSQRLEQRHWRDIKSTFSICPVRKCHRNQQPDPACQPLLGLFPGPEAGKPVGAGRNTVAWSMAVSCRKTHHVMCRE